LSWIAVRCGYADLTARLASQLLAVTHERDIVDGAAQHLSGPDAIRFVVRQNGRSSVRERGGLAQTGRG
jgi:hypothetical protein